MTVLIGALTIGVLLSLLALGVYITFRIFAFPDVTAEGSITLGACITATLLVTEPTPMRQALVAAGAAGVAVAVGLVWLLFDEGRSLRSLLAAGLGVGHWLIWMCCLPLGVRGDVPEKLFLFQGAVTPPAVLAGYLPWRTEDLRWERYDRRDGFTPRNTIPLALCGDVVWVVVGFVFWNLAAQRFAVAHGRELEGRPGLRPERRARPPDG